MNSKNSINKNNADSENQKQNDNEVINNFSNVKNIGKNRKRQRKKKENSDDPQNYSTAKTNFRTNEFIEANKDNIKLPNLLEQWNGNILMKDLKNILINENNNKKNSNNNNNIPLKEKDIVIEIKVELNNDNEDDSDDYDYKMSKKEEKTFKNEYKNVINKLMKNNDFVKYIKNFDVFNESKIKCFEDILFLCKKRYKPDDN